MKLLHLGLALTFSMSTAFSADSATVNGQEVESFVKRFYTEILDRPTDPIGLNNWTNDLTTGISPASKVAKGFIFSDEFRNKNTSNTQFLNILYKTFFNRLPDEEGFSYWVKELDSGTIREDILDGFLYSIEFDNLTKSYGIKANKVGIEGDSIDNFVKRFYFEILGRTASYKEVKSWTDKLKSKKLTGLDIAEGFIHSQEFKNKNLNSIEFLNLLYKAFFNRDADNDGLNYWLNQLEQGQSKTFIVSGFLHSEEFLDLCNNYNIIAYDGAPKYLLVNSSTDDNLSHHIYNYNKEGKILTHTAIDKIYGSQYPNAVTTTYSYNNGYLTNKRTSGLYYGGYTYTRYRHTVEDQYTNDTHGNILIHTNIKFDDTGTTPIIKKINTYTYNDKNQILIQETNTGSYLGYTYNALGNLTTLTVGDYKLPFDSFYQYTYDENNNLISEPILNGDIVMHYYSYDKRNRKIRSFSDSGYHSHDITYEYNEMDNLIKETLKMGTEGSDEVDISETIYDTKRNIINEINSHPNITFLNVYDPYGNILIKTRLTNSGSTKDYTTYSYDSHHNLTRKNSNHESSSINYEWTRFPKK